MFVGGWLSPSRKVFFTEKYYYSEYENKRYFFTGRFGFYAVVERKIPKGIKQNNK